MIRLFILLCCLTYAVSAQESSKPTSETAAPQVFRLGIIGTTTSHVPAFIGILNDPKREGLYREFEVVGAYPGGMPDNPDSWNRVETYKKQAVEKGVAIYPTIEAMLPHVDGVLLESVDGRCHLEQAKPVLEAGKPMFIDKPLAATLADSIRIYRLAEEKQIPVFSSSSLRYSTGIQAIRTNSPIGGVLGAVAWSPSRRNPTHSPLIWYGIHGVEILYTIMGPGCETVSCIGSNDCDLASGIWKDGRIGTFRGDRVGRGGYGATVFGTKGTADAGKYEGYKPLVEQICKFFKEKKSPIDPSETLEMFAFMEAAAESLENDGKSVRIQDVLERARNEKQCSVTVKIAADRSLTLEGKKIETENLAEAVGNAAPPDVVVKILLHAEKGYDTESLEKVLKNFGRGKLALFLYE